MAKDTSMKGMAGVHYVAMQLSFREIHAAITTGNAPNVDVLASSKRGNASIGIQVKTTENALRFRGRGENKTPYEYQFPIGEKFAKNLIPNLWFAFVDLKMLKSEPDVYILNSEEVVNTFSGIEELKLWRFHQSVDFMEPFMNSWERLEYALSEAEGGADRFE